MSVTIQPGGLDAIEWPEIFMKVPLEQRRKAAMAILTSLVVGLAVKQSQLIAPTARAFLEAAANDLPYRRFETRLSGAFAYRPLQALERDANAVRRKFAPAVSEALRLADAHPTAASLQTAGVARLLRGDVNEAISLLERALSIENGLDSGDASNRGSHAALLTDLASAYVTRARTGRVSDFLRALPMAERSWQLGHTPAAAWNRAIACESLFLDYEAAEAWRDVLRIEPEREWRNEAARHARALTTARQHDQRPKTTEWLIAALRAGDRDGLAKEALRFPSQMSSAGMTKLLDWAAGPDSTDGDHAALRDARLIADALIPFDPFLRDTIAAIDKAAAAKDQQKLVRLLAGTRALARGRKFYDERRFDYALSSLRQATKELDGAASCLSLSSRTLAASCLIYSQRYAEAAREIVSVTNDRRGRPRYPRIFAQSEWLAGLSQLALGKPYEALQSYATAQNLFARMADTGSIARIEDLEGEAYEHLGMGEESWLHRYAALSWHASTGDGNRSEAIFGGAARAAVKLGQYGVALHFVDAILPTKRDDPFAFAELLVLRGAIRQRLGMMKEAIGDFQDARLALSRVPAGGAREALTADIRAVELLIGAQPDVTGREAKGAIAAAQEQGNKFRLVPLLRLRAVSAEGSQPMAAAESALAEMERELSTMRDQDIRLTSQRSLHDLYVSLIETAVNAGDIRRAAQLLDCEREQTRLGISAGPCTDLPLSDVPADVAILDYTIVGNDLLVFSYHDGALEARRMPMTVPAIAPRARDFVNAIQKGDDDKARSLAARLCGDLFDPFIGNLKGATTIVIIGSPSTISLPFSALWSARTGRYLVEDWTIIYAPGVSRLAAAVRRDRALRARPRAELDVAVFAPEYDPSVPPHLSGLPAAVPEARAVRRLYRTGSSWTGSAASERSFLDEAGRAAIVHFAGHSINNDSQPRYAALAMSNRSGQATPMLYAYQIAQLEWSSTRLVVLASCSSAAKTDVPSVAPISLADAFLDAHVPGIVATVWPIEDDASISLVKELHKNLQAGRAAPAALRVAQIAALRSGDSRRASPKYWAPYCFIGWNSNQ